MVDEIQIPESPAVPPPPPRPEPELHKVISVTASDEAACYIVKADITDITGARYVCDYVARQQDTFGLAPSIWAAATGWIASGKGVLPVLAPERIVPDRVSSRQFKLQLHSAGLLNQVEAWIAVQNLPTQIAYASSRTFVRSDTMIKGGFAALGFTPQQIDDFYVAAGAL